MKNSIYAFLCKDYEKEMLINLKKFIAINSVYDENTVDETNPFGKGVTKALEFIADLAKKDGFEVTNYDNKVVEIICGQGDKNLTIMAHADVVPTGEGWKYDPFTMTEEKGILYGRGVADDKGPLLSCYYALKAMRDNHLLGDYQVRFLVGGNEERGSACMEHYFQVLKKPQPTYGFTPDSDFPLIFAEKAIIHFTVSKKLELNGIDLIKAGVASNAVIDRCLIKMNENQFFLKYLKDNKIDFEYEINDNKMNITFIGMAAHGSTPQLGINAGMIALKALANFFDIEDLKHIVNCYSDLNGRGVNAYSYSKEMKENSLNVGIINYENDYFSMMVDFRHVNGVRNEDLINNIIEASKPFEINIVSKSNLLFYPLDSVLVKTLLEAYQEETDDFDSEPLAIGGGTYAKEANNVVAFGLQFPGKDAKMHSPGENVSIDDLNKAMAIYARAIVELGKKINEN